MTTPEPASHGPRASGVAAQHIDWDAEEAGHDTWRGGERRGGPRRMWWVIGSLAVVLMTGMAVWFGYSAAHGHVQWVNTGHVIVSDTAVDVRFDLRRDAARAVTCVLEAQDGRHAVIGRAQVTVGPADASPSRHIESVETAARAVTGYVDRCWYADEAPPEQR